MEHFLEICASDLFQNFCTATSGLSDITVVFPNRRARLFFDEYLSRLTLKPVWSPRYVTIEELFHSQSRLRVTDRYQLVALLYKAYVSVTKSTESLDSFWSWGELMLADFEDIDRNMAPSDRLFRLLQEQKEMEADHSYLTEQQQQAIMQFFAGLKNKGQTDIQHKYLEIWAALGPIYELFRQDLLSKGLAYDGMLQRMVAMELDADRFPARCYAFIGFNGLDAAERRLFSVLQAAGKAIFYWDYDKAYVDDKLAEAGLYLRRNIKDFPGRLSSEHYDSMSSPKNLTIVRTQTDSAQTAYIETWLSRLDRRPDKDCAVVLADSGLVTSVLHAIPPGSTDALNMTMGYPLPSTQVYALAMALLDLQIAAMKNAGKVGLDEYCRLLDNPLLAAVDPETGVLRNRLTGDRVFRATLDNVAQLTDSQLLKSLFKVCNGSLELLDWMLAALKTVVPAISENTQDTARDSTLQPLNKESLLRTYSGVQRMRSLMADGILDIQTDTLVRLIRKLLQGMSVPFHGEPVVGMQVMGLIETRNLDFENVLLLSSHEGSLPGSMNQQSFIPYNLRVAFGLTTMKDKSAVAAYNFHHLIQRARNVTFVYNGNPDAGTPGSGQISRYLLQLETQGHKINHENLQPDFQSTDSPELTLEKTPELIERLAARYDADKGKSYLSPSALNTYIDCGTKFWLKYVCGIKERRNRPDDIDNAMFGSIFHMSAQLAYNDMALRADGMITRPALESLAKDKDRLESFVQQAFDHEMFNPDGGNRHVSTSDYSGIQILNYKVICRYLRQVLEIDHDNYAPFRYLASETSEFSRLVEVPCPGRGTVKVRLGGQIDRMDSKDGIVRIVDYKTGMPKDAPKTVGELFDGAVKKRNYHAFQTFYYASIVCKTARFAQCKVAPMLLYVRSSSKSSDQAVYMEMNKEPLTDFAGGPMDDYWDRLKELIAGIFDPETPLTPAPCEDTCKHCDFFNLCQGKTQTK